MHTKSARETGFAERLRDRGRNWHEAARHTDYLDALLGGELSRAGYAGLVAQHYQLYSLLEEASARMRTDPIAGRFVFDELSRTAALEADLRHLHGPQWRDHLEPTPATVRYLDRIREVCFDWPGGFIAHHYTRYLGDLSGGRIVGRRLAEVYGIDGDGARFYAFDLIPKPPVFKAAYRELLDDTGWDDEEQDRVIEESLLAYQLNTDMLVDLAAVYLPRIPSPANTEDVA
ncbi:biliverdin-producing heme oxygenase [Actinoalloteichus hymeniacidonis]|uniref:Heme oxygenase n=1 Tax=Actinoalloteichus hymeniacidonis TaxID=340345 RepID=A0AAC9HX39_9PSEU|nr:biliverdin-producing heme oxygenase [Actinoalloteichus hymeniacidonis]AOS66080.1 heme oxygenase [Actinoalloteichus hymeniacidonis]MBB5905816.1 heme oxygenase [Actinoalloteichus hymeniacidonis]